MDSSEFEYIKSAFLAIRADLSSAGKKAAEAGEIAAEQRAARQKFERLKSMNAEEFLKSSSSSSAKCLLGYIRAAQWRADQNPDNLLSARQLLEEATNAGSLEALFSLGTIKVRPPGANYMSPPLTPTYLVADEGLRRDYIERAAEAGYRKAIKWLEEELEEFLTNEEFRLEGESCIAEGEYEDLQSMASRLQEQEPETPQWRAKAAAGDLAVATRLADWLIGTSDDIRACRHPGF